MISDIRKIPIQIEQIDKYPFDISLQNNYLHLSYTVFAGKSLLDKLSIEIQGYRRIVQPKQNLKKGRNKINDQSNNYQKSCVVLICHDNFKDQIHHHPSESSMRIFNQERIYTSYHIIDYFGNCESLQIWPLETPFSLRNINNYILPDVRPLKELFINVNFDTTLSDSQIDSQFLTKIISRNPFLIDLNNKKCQQKHSESKDLISYYSWSNLIDLSLFQNNDTDISNLSSNFKSQSNLRRKICQNQAGLIKNYLQISFMMKWQKQAQQINQNNVNSGKGKFSLEQIQGKHRMMIFEPGVTKISVISSNLAISSSIKSMREAPSIYQKIYTSQIYKQFIKGLSNILFGQNFKKNVLINLHCDRGVGLTTLISNFCQDKTIDFSVIDCSQMASPRQLSNILKGNRNNTGQDRLIFVKNTAWLKIIANTSSNSSGESSSNFDPFKNCLKSIEEAYYEGVKQLLNRTYLILSFEQNIDSEVFEKAQNLQFILSKQDKALYCKQILERHLEKKIEERKNDEPALRQEYKIDHESVNTEESESLLLKTANGIGWTLFNKINDIFKHKFQKDNSRLLFSFEFEEKQKINLNSKQKQNLDSYKIPLKFQNDFLKGLLEEIHKHTKVQKVENIANVKWDDIGGLETAKEEIIQTIMLPSKHPQIFDDLIKPRTGLLFYGPPGTGKTMLGKCIANECGMGFISVKGPQLLNMYIGESEKNLRRLFERAYKSRPCIVFMDELDALIPKRGNSSDSNQVMDRIVSQLLMQMDLCVNNGVFIIGATNRPDLLDPSILVSGRFDKQIYLGIANEDKDRKKILQAQTRNLKLSEDVNFEQLLKIVPKNLTGADFYGLTSKAIMNAMERVVEEYQRMLQQRERQEETSISSHQKSEFLKEKSSTKIKMMAEEKESFAEENENQAQNSEIIKRKSQEIKHEKSNVQIIIRQEDFLEAAKTVVPSVSETQLKHYESLKQKYT